MPRIASSLLFASSLLLLGACPGDAPGPGPDEPVDPEPPGTAAFSALDADRIELLVSFAANGIQDDLYDRYVAVDFDSDYGCPTLVEAGRVDTYTGGCTVGDRAYTGVLTATNVVPYLGEIDVDPLAPSRIELDMFDVSGDTFDGSWTKSLPTPEPGQALTIEIEYTRTGPYIPGAYLYTAECVAGTFQTGHQCTVEGDVDAEGYGGSFVIRGELQVGYTAASGWLELEGAETLRVDFDASVDGCAPITIDGAAAGSYCWS